jgi:hypothetical protein
MYPSTTFTVVAEVLDVVVAGVVLSLSELHPTKLAAKSVAAAIEIKDLFIVILTPISFEFANSIYP